MTTIMDTPTQMANDWVGSIRHSMSSVKENTDAKETIKADVKQTTVDGSMLKLVAVAVVLIAVVGLFLGRFSALAVFVTSLILSFGFKSMIASARQDSLAQANKSEQLRQRAQATDEFMASIAHDMRTPLTTVEMYSRMLSDSKNLTDSQRNHMAKMLLSSKEALLELIERVPEKRYALIEERFDVGKSTRDAVNLINVQAIKKGINVRVNKIDADVEVDGSPALMRRAILNLLSNAIKYTPEGGEVMVSVIRENGTAAIDIQDTGIGIPKNELPYIFEPFKRGTTHDETIDGTGLGLSVVQQVVDAHHGLINVKSETGLGSSFTMYLPLAEQVTMTSVAQRISA